MTVYLDEPLIDLIEAGVVRPDEVAAIVPGGSAEFVYSPLHVLAACRLPPCGRLSAAARSGARLSLLEGIAPAGCLMADEDGGFAARKCSPAAVAKALPFLPYGAWMTEGLGKADGLPGKWTARERIGIKWGSAVEKITRSEDLTELLDRLYTQRAMAYLFSEEVELIAADNELPVTVERVYRQMAALWKLLESVGYVGAHHQKGAEPSFVPYGPLHAAFATRAQVFMTTAVPKARIMRFLYHQLGYDTHVMAVPPKLPVFERPLYGRRTPGMGVAARR